MKRFFFLLFAMGLLLALIGCDKNPTNSPSQEQDFIYVPSYITFEKAGKVVYSDGTVFESKGEKVSYELPRHLWARMYRVQRDNSSVTSSHGELSIEADCDYRNWYTEFLQPGYTVTIYSAAEFDYAHRSATSIQSVWYNRATVTVTQNNTTLASYFRAWMADQFGNIVSPWGTIGATQTGTFTSLYSDGYTWTLNDGDMDLVRVQIMNVYDGSITLSTIRHTLRACMYN
ncbi:MAG: hypothetical protein ONB42_11915 [candidate division KSB1 bacterium]|nr:hypothetical protein [candidate division KSB1 bacterium]MDZ7312201.1 hypothetical protein [candidate division KSB1 bacterium]